MIRQPLPFLGIFVLFVLTLVPASAMRSSATHSPAPLPPTTTRPSHALPTSASTTPTYRMFEAVGHIGGDYLSDVAVAGTYAYAANEVEFTVFDVADPAQIRRIGYTILPSSVTRVLVDGNYAYVLAKGLWIIDIRDPMRPTKVGHVPGLMRDVVVRGNYAYAISDRLQVINLTDRAFPREVNSLDGQGLDVTLDGNKLYVPFRDKGTDGKGTTGFRILDLADPARPQVLGSYTVSGGFYVSSIVVSGNIAYFTFYFAGAYVPAVAYMHIIDVANPTTPKLLGEQAPTGQVIAGQYRYRVSLSPVGPATLHIADIRQPLAPVEVATLTLGEIDYTASITVHGAVGYIAAGQTGLLIVDLANPAAPVLVGRSTPVSEPLIQSDFAVAGTYAYMTTDLGLQVIDLSRPSLPTPVASIPGHFDKIVVANQYAYVADSGTALPNAHVLHVFDISNPAAPVEVGSIGELNIGSLAVAGTTVYIGWSDLTILDVSNPAMPRIRSQLDLPEFQFPNDIAVAGKYAYLSGDSGFRVVDVANPDAPTLAGSLQSQGFEYRHGIAVDGVHAYAGKKIINISDPQHPVVVGQLPEGYIWDIAAADGYAYLMVFHSDQIKLQVLDTSNPAAPVEVGAYFFPGHWGRSKSVQVVGDTIYSLIPRGGLFILRDLPGPVQRSLLPLTTNVGPN